MKKPVLDIEKVLSEWYKKYGIDAVFSFASDAILDTGKAYVDIVSVHRRDNDMIEVEGIVSFYNNTQFKTPEKISAYHIFLENNMPSHSASETITKFKNNWEQVHSYTFNYFDKLTGDPLVKKIADIEISKKT